MMITEARTLDCTAKDMLDEFGIKIPYHAASYRLGDWLFFGGGDRWEIETPSSRHYTLTETACARLVYAVSCGADDVILEESLS